MDRTTFHDIVDKAKNRERGSYLLYKKCADRSTDPVSKKFFLELAEEEKEHEKKLDQLSFKKSGNFNERKLEKLMLSDFFIDIKFKKDLSLQDVVIFAIKAEEHAVDFYGQLAEATEDSEAKELFLHFVQEEIKHKENLEKSYEDQFYQFF